MKFVLSRGWKLTAMDTDGFVPCSAHGRNEFKIASMSLGKFACLTQSLKIFANVGCDSCEMIAVLTIALSFPFRAANLQALDVLYFTQVHCARLLHSW